MTRYKKEYNLKLQEFIGGYEGYSEYIEKLYISHLYDDWSFPSNFALLPVSIKERLRFNLIPDNFRFVWENFMADKDCLFGFLQEWVDDNKEIIQKYQENPNIPDFSGVIKHYRSITDPFISTAFSLDVEFDFVELQFKKSINEGLVHEINSVSQDLSGSNEVLYSKCVADFINFRNSSRGQDFYHESLDRMKELVENYLKIHYDSARLSDKSKIANVLFDGTENQLIINNIEWVIKKIHHNDEGERTKLTRKEWVYLWLELNKILYLLAAHKK